ncbi:HotDog domain-containing protein [Amylostereum chailletii]|nr:HotDog domain-containing protein [Amylostereum chailletii]
MLLVRCLRPSFSVSRILHTGNRHTSSSSIRHLQNAFRDPTSPYHIPPGTQGPASADEPPSPDSIAAQARAKLASQGYDPTSFWEQQIVWGDHDAFQHVNNVRYVRFFESGRMQWISAVGRDLGGPEVAKNLLSAKGISFILKSIEIKFRRPVTFPDTLLIAHKPRSWSTSAMTDASRGPPLHRTQFYLDATAYSFAQHAVVADSTSVITWYDYDKLSKCDPGDALWAPVWARMK